MISILGLRQQLKATPLRQELGIKPHKTEISPTDPLRLDLTRLQIIPRSDALPKLPYPNSDVHPRLSLRAVFGVYRCF